VQSYGLKCKFHRRDEWSAEIVNFNTFNTKNLENL